MNTYLIISVSKRLIDDEVKKIINGKDNIVYFNYDELIIDDLIDECNYYSLINEHKYVIVRNFKIKSDSKKLDSYLDNPNENTTLLLLSDNIDKRSTIYKKIKSKGNIIEIGELKSNELISKINDYCLKENITIDYQSINKLLEYNMNNYDLVLNDIDKLKISFNKIDENIVNNYGAKLISDNTFELIDAIVSKKYNLIDNLLNNYIEEKKEIIPLITMLANQYRIIYTIKELKYSNEEISNILNVHPYRVKIARDKEYLYTKKELENNLLNLCELDKNLKSLNVNQYVLFKDYLINTI